MADKEVRKMTFGKYKGQPILKVIAEHIGYIMWCFENINWFELTEDEQNTMIGKRSPSRNMGVR